MVASHKLLEWKNLHKAHVDELRFRFDDLFRRFPKLDSIVIHSGLSKPLYSADDQYWPRVNTPHFAYWTPYQATRSTLVIKPSLKPQLIREEHQSFWEGPTPSSDLWSEESFTISECKKLSEFEHYGSLIYIGDDESARPASAWPASEAIDVIRAMDVMRTKKTPYEVECIREATRLALPGHKRLRELFCSSDSPNSHHHLTEAMLHIEYLKVTGQTDFTVPYGVIVGMGRNAGILHHVHYSKNPADRDDSLLVDAGATFHGYASDITRTWVRGSSKAAEHFRELVDGVTRIQKDLAKKFTVGTTYESLHNQAQYDLAKLMIDLGWTTESDSSLVDSGATRCFFPHGLGHSLGLQVHDVAMRFVPPADQNASLRNTSVIQAGHVVTVEPGMYFIPTLLTKLKTLSVSSNFNWPLIESLIKFGGVRVEDNLLATEQGPVNLTSYD
jgi:Xaa-Pro dipeptidase